MTFGGLSSFMSKVFFAVGKHIFFRPHHGSSKIFTMSALGLCLNSVPSITYWSNHLAQNIGGNVEINKLIFLIIHIFGENLARVILSLISEYSIMSQFLALGDWRPDSRLWSIHLGHVMLWGHCVSTSFSSYSTFHHLFFIPRISKSGVLWCSVVFSY